jgi:hypothetical protein
MEVHAHTHTERKKFTHYLWEFLMLFLAVFCGFLAENFREHQVEHQREKQYMISLARDLKNDIHAIDDAIKDKIEKISWADTVFKMFEQKSYQQQTADLYFYGRSLSTRNFFTPNDGTLQQLKNAGGFRLIKKSLIADKIQSYSNQLVDISALQQLEESQIVDYRRSMSRIFDALEFNKMYASKTSIDLKKLDTNPPLLSSDKFDINDLNTRILVMKGNRLSQIPLLNGLKKSANELIELISQQYHLK